MHAQRPHDHAQSSARGDLVAGLRGHITADAGHTGASPVDAGLGQSLGAKGLAKAGVDGARAGVARIRGDVPAQARYEVSSRGGLGMVVGALGVHVREYGRPRSRRSREQAGRKSA